MAEMDLEARVRELEEKDEIRAFVARYCELNDALTRLDELIDLFAPDAVMENATGPHIGREAIGAYYRAFFDGTTEFARHHTTNQVIDIVEPGVARHRSYFVALLGRQGESKVAFGAYDDTIVKTDAGWKFSRKVNDVAGVTTPAEGWAHGFAAGVR